MTTASSKYNYLKPSLILIFLVLLINRALANSAIFLDITKNQVFAQINQTINYQNLKSHQNIKIDQQNSYKLNNFEIIFYKKTFKIKHLLSNKFLLDSSDDSIIKVERIKQKASLGTITLKFKTEYFDKITLQDLFIKKAADNYLILSQKLTGKCAGKTLFIKFREINPQSLDLIIQIFDDHYIDDDIYRSMTYPSNSTKPNSIKPPRTKKTTCYDTLAIKFKKVASETFLGLGTQYTHLNLEGHHFTTLSQEQGHGRGLQPLTWFTNNFAHGSGGDETSSYNYVPHIISSRLRSLWINSNAYSHFDFTKLDSVRITSTQPSLHLTLNTADSIKTLIKIFSDRFGTMKRMPSWVHKGAIIAAWGGQHKITQSLDKLKAADTKISSLWIQDWIGRRNTFIGQRLLWQWTLDEDLYPNWSKFIDQIQNNNIKVLSYFSPRFVDNCQKYCFYDYAEDQDFFVKDEKNQTILIKNGGFNFAKLDLSNQNAKNWFKEIIINHLNSAEINGWMMDFSESLPFKAVMANKLSGEDYHNQYIYEWSKFNSEISDNYQQNFIFARSGTLGSHKYVHAFWLGDQLTSWDKHDGLHSTIIGLISSGLSGAIVNHSDIGGFTSIRIPLVANIRRTKELFFRWLQMNAFTPILRTHEGLWPLDAHQHDSDEETLHLFSYYSQIYAALHPYREYLLDQGMKTGLPLIRGMFIHYPDNYLAWRIDDQFMLGSDMIVAPIIKKSTNSRDVYLPPGSWSEIFSNTTYTIKSPRYVKVHASKYSIPVFVKTNCQVHKDLSQSLKKLGSFDYYLANKTNK